MVGIEFEWYVVLVFFLILGLIAVTLIAAGGLIASIPSVIIALVARRFGTRWLQARAISHMSPREVMIAVAAASTVAALVGGMVGFQMGSFVAFFVVTWLIAIPLSAIILFSDPQRHR